MAYYENLQEKMKKIKEETGIGEDGSVRTEQPAAPQAAPTKPKPKGKCPIWIRPEDCARMGYK